MSLSNSILVCGGNTLWSYEYMFIVNTNNTHNIIVIEHSLLDYKWNKNKIITDGTTTTLDCIEHNPGNTIDVLYTLVWNRWILKTWRQSKNCDTFSL
jgi:hypothetical protein